MEKNKLKYLFGYFKALGANEAQTSMQIDWNSIDDWNEDFDLYKDKDGRTFTKNIEPIRPIIQIIEELISENMRDIQYMTNLEWDQYFTLYISIFPKENRLVFETSSKVKMWDKESLDLKLSDLNHKNYNFIKNIQNGENPISGGEKVTKIDYNFDGYYDHFDVSDLELDDELLYMDTEISESFWDVIDEIISNKYGQYWAEEDSVEGDIRIWGDDIFMKFNYGYQDWQDSESKIEIKI
jgi:hypothetical protein